MLRVRLSTFPVQNNSRLVHRAAALATGCQVSIEHMWGSTFDLRQNKTLGTPYKILFKVGVERLINKNPVDELTDIFENKYGGIDHGSTAMQGVSTDFVRRLQYPIYPY